MNLCYTGCISWVIEVMGMEMADFNGYEQNQRMYGGTAGRKMGISVDGKDSEISGESERTGNEEYQA